MKLATYGWDEVQQRHKVRGKGPVVMRETATPGQYESVGVFASYEVAAHVVLAVNSFYLMREALGNALSKLTEVRAVLENGSEYDKRHIDGMIKQAEQVIRHALKLSEES